MHDYSEDISAFQTDACRASRACPEECALRNHAHIFYCCYSSRYTVVQCDILTGKLHLCLLVLEVQTVHKGFAHDESKLMSTACVQAYTACTGFFHSTLNHANK